MPVLAYEIPDEIRLSLVEVRRRHVEEVVALCHGNQRMAARLLDIDRKTLARWLAAWRQPSAMESAASRAALTASPSAS